jgi:arabinan endo-1,5-alpha-L-arabinosidase
MDRKTICISIGNLIALTVVSFAVQSFANNEAYVNPLKGDIGVHDPCMGKDGTTYYVFGTADWISSKSSTDRSTWKNANVLLPTPPAWFSQQAPGNDGKNIWAPDISFRNGQFWLYYAVSSFGKNTSAIGLATNATLNPAASNYQWVDKGAVVKSVSSDNYNCIDPNAFTDSDSTSWLVFGSWWSGIKLVQLDPKTGKTLSATPTLFSLASHTGGIEAPFIIKWKSYYYLFVAWDVCCQGVASTYKIVLGRSSSLKGPYVDKNNTPMLSGGGFKLDTGDTRWKGPGGASIFIEHDTAFCVNHAYDANNNGSPTMMIRPLYWDSNNWPTFTKPPVAILSNSTDPAIKNSAHTGIFCSTPEALKKIKASAAHATIDIYTVSGKRVTNEFLKTYALPGIFILDSQK